MYKPALRSSEDIQILKADHFGGTLGATSCRCSGVQTVQSRVTSHSFPANMAEGEAPKKRTFKKYSYRGVDLDKLLDMSNQDLMELFCARQRRKFSRGIKRAPITVLKKLRKAKRDTAYGEKPEAVKTHLRNMVIVPEMIGSVVGVYNGKQYITVEIKPEMIGHYLGEFSITYKPIKHGRAGMMSKNSQFEWLSMLIGHLYQESFVPILWSVAAQDNSPTQKSTYFEAMAEGEAPKKRTFKKYSYRGVDLDKLLDMSNQERL
eukprot:s1928_g5.t1